MAAVNRAVNNNIFVAFADNRSIPSQAQAAIKGNSIFVSSNLPLDNVDIIIGIKGQGSASAGSCRSSIESAYSNTTHRRFEGNIAAIAIGSRSYQST